MKFKKLTKSIFATLLLSTAVIMPASQAQQIDTVSGLLMTEGWLTVQANCTECHSAQIILQNSGSREVWQSRIVWMQETQGLRQLEAALESSILDYLTANYGPKAASRRAGLEAHFLPENPYEKTN